MSTWSHYPTSDYRNEGWSLFGAGVTHLFDAWNNDDDTKYASCPSHKGRACVSFPIDISSVPDGAVITSITVYLRCKRDGTAGRSVTINLTCKDDTSRFTSRTIYPTSVITTFEIGTYQCDPRGFHWDRHRLNQLLCQVFSYSHWGDAIRCYKFWCVVNYRVRPTITVTAPTGTVTTPSPVITWTYSQDDGDPQSKAQYKIYTAQQQEEPSFNPDHSPPLYTNWVNGDITSLTLPTALTPDDYYIYVRAWSSYHAKSVWTGRTFTVQGSAPGVPGGTAGGPGTGAGAGFVSVIADPLTSSAFLMLRDGSNLLSVQAADFETMTDYNGYVATNCTLSRDTSVFYTAGEGSLKMVCTTGPTNMSATGAFVEVAINTPITIRAQFLAIATGRTCNIRILFYDATFTQISGTITGTGTSVTTSWTQIAATGTTPATAAYFKAQLEVVAPASSSVHNVDGVGVMYGNEAVWSHGGHSSRNILSAIASNADTPPVAQPEPWTTGSVATTFSRPGTTGTGADGANTFKMVYAPINPTITAPIVSTVYSDTSNSTGFTLNKPAGTADNDLLIAVVASTEAAVCTPPTGWTLVNTASLENVADDVALFILKRTGMAADPSTWVGNLSVAATRRRAVVYAYRGAAPAELQFGAENITMYATGSPNVTTATVANNDAGAWRFSAFAVRDDVVGGSMIANTQAPIIVPKIQYVGRASMWSSTSTTTSYTINKPSGVASGDLMVATVAIADTVSPTVTAPAGWTVVRQFDSPDPFAATRTAVLKRTAGGAEPASWTGTLSVSAFPIVSQASAYRNCLDASVQFLAEDQSVSASGHTINTATITNTNSSAWRICAFAGASDYYTASWLSNNPPTFSSNEVSERSDGRVQTTTGNDRGVNVAMYDSNGQISTGGHVRTGTLSRDYYSASSWIGIIKPLAAAPAAPANETVRGTVAVAGGSDPCLTTGVFDSNTVAPLGNQSVTAQFTPGSGSVVDATASWIGMIKPLAPIVAGQVIALLADKIDISKVDPAVLALADNNITFQVSFLGSTAGTPYLTLYFYNANELIATRVTQGNSFNATTWTKSVLTTDIPEGTTRVSARVHASDRLINDIVYFDRCAISLGDSTVYRPGTGRMTHPIWSLPIIEYADDDGTGYTAWEVLPGMGQTNLSYDQLTGMVTFNDQTIIPLTRRKYRAKTLSHGLLGDRFVSAYGPESDEVTLSAAADWWLKDPVFPENSMKLKVKAEPLDVGTTNTDSVFQPLGTDYPVVLTEGYKGDVIDLTLILDRFEYTELRNLLDTGRTLYLQSNMDNAWWVRPSGDMSASTQLTGRRGTDPIRFVKVQFVQVAPDD